MEGKPNSINWMFNFTDAKKAVVILGARNLTQVTSAFKESNDKIVEVSNYSKMVELGSQAADQDLIEWIKSETKKQHGTGEYLYFIFKRWN